MDLFALLDINNTLVNIPIGGGYAMSWIEAFGTVDEANAIIGLARLSLSGPEDQMLARIQNDLFDLGADLATPLSDEPPEFPPLRIVEAQVQRLETEIDRMNADLAPLTSFILPGGSAAT